MINMAEDLIMDAAHKIFRTAILSATALLLVTTLVACLVPALRAVRVDPSQAFRSE